MVVCGCKVVVGQDPACALTRNHNGLCALSACVCMFDVIVLLEHECCVSALDDTT